MSWQTRGFGPRAGILLLLGGLIAGCEANNPPPSPSPGTGTPETITGRERIGWDQAAGSAAELSTVRYAIYVDDARSELAEVTCSPAAPSGFACSGRLPAMSPGAHVLELSAFSEIGGILESARSAPLRVTVTASTSPTEAAPLVDGERLTTSDGVQLTASRLVEGLAETADMALATDGRLVIAERPGSIFIREATGSFRAALPEVEGELLAIALAPDFARSGHVFVIHTRPGLFRLCRYRLFGHQFVERLAVLPDVPASGDPAAALRFGPDGKLYAAFDDGGSRDAALRLSDWSGKVLRLNADGRTPDDQPAASPVFWSGLAAPRGLDWSPDGGALWMAERGHDGIERVRALVTAGERPRRAGQRASYVLPGTVGASSLAFHRGEAVAPFRGDLFIAARDGGYLLRVRFDEHERTRAVTTEKLLEGRLAGVRAVLTGPDDALYVATESAVWRLAPIHDPQSIRNPQ
ncbi:MAG TPA: PQQ-dependent sugar dehydrogenase [Vicinamibacterales bacterium]|nr:PQQ-dependent sugar dehydrogenase [Vicinamibacterales bacterium]